VKADCTIAQEEIFGPVLSIIPFKDEEDAIRIANGTVYGLAAAVWSRDETRAQRVARRLRAGQVDINGGGFNIQAPFGGYKQSGRGRELGKYSFKDAVTKERGDGSVMIVVATDAPVSDRNLERLAARAIMGLARTGSSASNGSGDFVIAFSTAKEVRRGPANLVRPDSTRRLMTTAELPNDDMSALFEGVVEATEEAIYNSLFMATTVTARGRTVEAIPLDRVREILARYNVVRR